MTTVLKAKSVLKGKHVHTTYFIGNEGQTLSNIGKLITTIGEWQIIGAALSIGADGTLGRLKVINCGDDDVIKSEQEGREEE
jgi:hypothetical protein